MVFLFLYFNLSFLHKYRSGYTEVPRLYDMCILILQENVGSIDECGNLSYDILEPILLRAKPNELINIEDHNPYLLEDTGKIFAKIISLTMF